MIEKYKFAKFGYVGYPITVIVTVIGAAIAFEE